MTDPFPTLPTDFGRYRLVRRLGVGGMGAVYLAEDTRLRNRKTAIKVPTRVVDEATAARFQREAEAAAILKHKHICPVYDVGEIAGRPYLAMEYVVGSALSSHMGPGKLWPVERAISLVLKLADAFQHAHDNGVIHRDIKPANVMLTANDDPVVMDFGLAKVIGDTTMTVAGAVFGTPHYMPLEQARGEIKQIGPHSDVYSLAVVLFELLTGVRPFDGDTPINVLVRMLADPIPPLRQLLPTADPALERVLLKGMAKEIAQRHATMAEFHVALQGYRPSSAAPPEPSTPEKTEPKRLETRCPNCQKTLSFAPTASGKTKKCPKCQTRMILPYYGLPAIRVSPPPSVERKAGDRHEIALPGGAAMALVWCPPGTFVMGSPVSELDRRDDEQEHPVTLTKGFYIGVHPVTQSQWVAVMGQNPSHQIGESLPVENVNWDDAQAFFRALRQRASLSLRLPTEAEWEYAARGGTTAPFHFGWELNGDQANCDGHHPYGTPTKGPYLQRTTPVGAFAGSAPHPWGLQDVHGNVWEWCEDWYDATFYAVAPEINPVCSFGERSARRVLRGGSWIDNPRFCRAAERFQESPSKRTKYFGFRPCFSPTG